MSSSANLLDFFKRKRNNSSTSSISPDKEHIKKKAKAEGEIDPVHEINEESDSILAELEDSEPETDMAESGEEGSVVKKLIEEFNKKFEEKMKTFREETTDLIGGLLDSAVRDIDHLKKEVKILKRENTCLKEEVSELRNSQQELKIEINRAEQYSRKDNVRIVRLNEKPQENTREAVCLMYRTELEVIVKPEDIGACHRLPSNNKDQPRPIIVRFRDRFTKENVMRARRKLKGKGITISDDITKENLKLMNRARNSGVFESVWFFNGKVRATKNSDAKRVVLELFLDFTKL
jgi:FtsZ-binding cell division protein ZapB